jgi:2',3'-cyclic-nucleotide 2'-phosphodiesterase (5'-nucleotidase family)
VLALLSTGLAASPAEAAPVRLTILHTNDLHSHFESDGTALDRGGIARIATAVKSARAQDPNVLLVDGGDWSEGDIFYRDGEGSESLRLMDEIGYDVAVVGNHDWLNGPDTLLGAIRSASPRMALVGANIDVSKYPGGAELTRRVLPYFVREVGGVKIAFIGLVTHEYIYNKYFKPVAIQSLASSARAIAKSLKGSVDAIVAISHNTISENKHLLENVPELDFVIGAHDHVALQRAAVVPRKGAPDGWVVEAGCWGRFLGRMVLELEPGAARPVRLVDYRLLQMDVRTPKDAGIQAEVDRLASNLESRYGPIFHDKVGETSLELGRDGIEAPIGDLVADAYRSATGAEIALDSTPFVYGELHEGALRSVDVYDAIPAIYDPATDKSWTLKVLPIKGRALRLVLDVLYSSTKLSESSGVNTAGLSIVFNPLFRDDGAGNGLLRLIQAPADDPRGLVLRELLVNGRPLEADREYTVAAGGGIIESLEFLDSIVGNVIPLRKLRDTGIEAWRVLRDHIRAVSPIDASKIAIGTRIRTVQPDLGLGADDISWVPIRTETDAMIAMVRARVTNFGDRASGGAMAHLSANANGIDFGLPAAWTDLGEPLAVPALAPGQSVTLSWDLARVPGDHGVFPITVRLAGAADETDTANDSATRFLRAP